VIFPENREVLSRMLRLAAKSRDVELAEHARLALRELGKTPTMPRMPRPAKAIRKGRAS
jgi:hypothetical protein